MAATAAPCGNCICNCKPLFNYFTHSVLRRGIIRSTTHLSSAAAVNQEIPLNKTPRDEPPKRLKRDKFTVLKALSSTVKQIPNKPHYRMWDDVVLNPRSNLKHNECLLALESGEKAADFVFEKYPQLFPLREPVPAWKNDLPIEEDVAETVPNLKLLMEKSKDVKKVVNLYEKLKENEELPIDIHCQMLDFACFHNVTNETADESSTKYYNEIYIQFKDAGNNKIHETMLLAVLKNESAVEAFSKYETLKSEIEGFKGSLFFYNSLLSSVSGAFKTSLEKWNKIEMICHDMSNAGVAPNQGTFNTILSITSSMEENPDVMTQKAFREMKKCQISPSLATLYYLLEAERNKTGYSDVKLLHAVIEELKSSDVQFNLLHNDDVKFFNAAIEMARFKRERGAAQVICDILMEQDNYEVLSGGKDSPFFGNYVCTMARDTNTPEEAMEAYRRVVPQVFRPHDWVYQQIFLNLKTHKAPQFVPELYKDMISQRIPMTDRVATPMFETLDYVNNIPKDKAEECLMVASDASKWLIIFNLKVTSHVLSTVVKIFNLCGKADEAREMIEEYKLKNVLPSYAAMSYMLKTNLEHEDYKAAMSTLKMMSEMNMNIPKDEFFTTLKHPSLADKTDLLKQWFGYK